MWEKIVEFLTLFGVVLTIGVFAVWHEVALGQDTPPPTPQGMFQGQIGVVCGPGSSLERMLSERKLHLVFRGQTHRGESPIEVRVYRSKAGEFVVSEFGVQGLACLSHQGPRSELTRLHKMI